MVMPIPLRKPVWGQGDGSLMVCLANFAGAESAPSLCIQWDTFYLDGNRGLNL